MLTISNGGGKMGDPQKPPIRVISCEGLEEAHVYADDQMKKELWRVLAGEGEYVLCEINIYGDEIRLGLFPKSNGYHHYVQIFPSPDMVIELEIDQDTNKPPERYAIYYTDGTYWDEETSNECAEYRPTIIEQRERTEWRAVFGMDHYDEERWADITETYE